MWQSFAALAAATCAEDAISAILQPPFCVLHAAARTLQSHRGGGGWVLRGCARPGALVVQLPAPALDAVGHVPRRRRRLPQRVRLGHAGASGGHSLVLGVQEDVHLAPGAWDILRDEAGCRRLLVGSAAAPAWWHDCGRQHRGQMLQLWRQRAGPWKLEAVTTPPACMRRCWCRRCGRWRRTCSTRWCGCCGARWWRCAPGFRVHATTSDQSQTVPYHSSVRGS